MDKNNGMLLKKFKSAAIKVLQLERERNKLENQQPNRVLQDPLPEKKCALCAVKSLSAELTSSTKPMHKSIVHWRLSSQRPITGPDQGPLEHKADPNSNISNTKSNSMPPAQRRLPDKERLQRRPREGEIYPRRQLDTLEKEVYQRRTHDEHRYQRYLQDDRMQQCHRRQEDNAQHRRHVKKVHEGAHQHVRASTAASAAAAAAAVAQMRKDAIDAVARKQAPYMRLAALSSAATNPANGTHSYPGGHKEDRRVIRNSNLLSSALSIIREMDPAFLETLCYAIHDQVTKDEHSDTD